MKVPTALSFIVGATALFVTTRPRTPRTRTISQILGTAVILLAAQSLVAHFGIYPALLHSSQRMAPLTAMTLVGFGTTFILLASSNRRAAGIAHTITLVLALVIYLVLAGYFLDVKGLHLWPGTVSINTGVASLALCAGIFHLRPDTWLMNALANEGVGGIMFRRLFPAILILPVVIGTLRSVAVQRGFLTQEMDALAVVANGVVMLWIMWITTRSANRADNERQQATERLQRQSEWLQVTLHSIGDAVLAADTAGRITFLNPVAALMTGWTEQEAIGHQVQTVCPIFNEETLKNEDLVGRVLASGKVILLGNHAVLTRRDGRRIPIEDSAAPIRELDGEIVGVVVVFHDVTEKQQDRDSAEHRLLALDAGRLGTWEYKVKTGQVVWDDRSLAMFGFSHAEEVPYDRVLLAVHPEDRPRFAQSVHQALIASNDSDFYEEFRTVSRDGTELWIAAHGRIFFEGEEGQHRPRRFIGVNADITERKRAEERVRHQNNVLRSLSRLLESGAAASNEKDLGKTCLEIAAELTQSRFALLSEIGSDGCLHIIASSDSGWNVHGVQAGDGLRITGIEGISEHVLRDGEGFFVNNLLAVPLVRDGKAIGLLAVRGRHGDYSSADLEALEALTPAIEQAFREKRSEWALRESETQFRTLANAIPQLCWMADASGWIFWYNDRWYEYTGTKPEQMEGWGWQSVHDPKMLPQVLERWKASISSGEPFEMVFPIRGSDDVFRPFLTRVMPVHDHEGGIVRWFGTNTDISAQKQSEQEIRSAKELLETIVKQTPAGLAMLDHDLRYVRISDRWTLDTGLSGDSLIGKHHYDVFPDLPDHWKDAHRRGLAGEVVKGEDAWINNNGETHSIRWEIHPWGDCVGGTGGISILSHDITDLKRQESELRNSEKRFRTLVESMPGIVFTLNEKGANTFTSARFHEYTGASADWMVGDGWLSFAHTDDRAWAMAECARSVREGGPFEFEVRFRRYDGAYRWHLCKGVPLRAENDQVTNWFGTCTDIEDYKMVEAAIKNLNSVLETRVEKRTRELRDSEERLRLFIENVKDYAILMLDPQGLVMSWSPAAERIKGYRQEEILGKSFKCFYPTSDVAVGHPDFLLETARRQGHFEEDGWRVRKDGSRFWANVVVTAVYDEAGGLRGFSKITRDISERRRVEQQLHEREEQFRVLLECAPDAIVIVDEQGDLALINAQAEKLFGYARQELIGQPVEKLIPADMRSTHVHHRGRYQHSPRVRQMGTGMMLQGMRRNGEMFPVEVSLSPIQTSQGAWVAAGIRDITERKIAEERLVSERKRAETANRAKSDFLAAMSHEIRTPMNVILGMSDLLWESELSVEQKEYVSVFRRAGSNLLSLIDNILDFSKIESGHFELECVEFDLEDVVDQAVELIAAKARAKNLSLMCHLLPGLATSLIGDPTRLRQVLINLLSNAVKFTEAGHVLLTVQNSESGIPGELKITVSDTGIGIAPEHRVAIFGEFTQADNSITRKYGGSGLGLAISKHLAQRIGGELTVSSVVGEGSDFTFTARFEVAAKQTPRTPQQLDDIHGRRVMVIDNNPANCLILREALSAWGLVPQTFERPQEALDHLSNSHVDPDYALIIVDKRIPGTDGFEVAEQIMKVAPLIPIVMLSSDAALGDVTRSSKAGLAGYAVKPVKRSDLFRLVCKALNIAFSRESQPAAVEVNVFRGPALRILVAEDSHDNRLLVEAYLKGTPHEITFVEDGEAAVKEFAHAEYDLVLMDLQMPNMDGLTATRNIRSLEAGGRTSVPIVALSANARPEDVELSRLAGCDGHLFKPISKPKLLGVIADYGLKQAVRETAREPVGNSTILIEAPEGLEDLTAQYIAKRKQEAPVLMELLKLATLDPIRVAGHNMKGTGASYGIPMLTTLGAAIEAAAKTADIQALQKQLAELSEYLDRVEI